MDMVMVTTPGFDPGMPPTTNYVPTPVYESKKCAACGGTGKIKEKPDAGKDRGS